jgi:hypothetical protein
MDNIKNDFKPYIGQKNKGSPQKHFIEYFSVLFAPPNMGKEDREGQKGKLFEQKVIGRLDI